MAKGVYPHKPLSQAHKDAISRAHKGNQYSKGKNLGNRHAYGKTRGPSNGNWKGGDITHTSGREYRAGRARSPHCEVCYVTAPTDFDHDHKTEKFRGWLCRRCNLVLGMVKDNPRLLRNLAKYLDIQDILTRPILLSQSLLETYAIQGHDSSSQNKEA